MYLHNNIIALKLNDKTVLHPFYNCGSDLASSKASVILSTMSNNRP